VIVFQSKTGWGAVLLTILGALTAADVLPLVSAFLTEAVGEKAAHAFGLVLTIAGAVVAKLSHSTPPDEPPTP
jgi:hypothetical protein